MISIIIPVYNGEKYLKLAVESALNQTYQDKEIIIVNDGSTDDTPKLMEQWNCQKINHKKNMGTAAALNSGIRIAKGNWIKWLSADDILEPDALEQMMRHISTIPRHDQYIFYTNFTMIDQKGEIIKEFVEPDRTNTIRKIRNAELMHNFYGNGSSSLIHRSIFEKCGYFREGLSHNEDLEFWMRACLRFGHTLYHLPINILQYRMHPESLTSTKDVNENLDLVLSFRKEYEQYLDDEQKQYVKSLEAKIPLRRKMLRRMPAGLRSNIVSVYRKVK